MRDRAVRCYHLVENCAEEQEKAAPVGGGAGRTSYGGGGWEWRDEKVLQWGTLGGGHLRRAARRPYHTTAGWETGNGRIKQRSANNGMFGISFFEKGRGRNGRLRSFC